MLNSSRRAWMSCARWVYFIDRRCPEVTASDTGLVHAVVSFYEGARAHATGLLLSNNDVVRAALVKVQSALAVIDAISGTGRDILIPFLQHRDPMVRCEAAQALHPTHRNLATPILQDLDLTCVTEAASTAHVFLTFAGEPNKSSDLLATYHPPRYDDTLYREALERFDRS